MTTKEDVNAVFDAIASQRSWENLYGSNVDRTSYNFVTRQRAVEEILAGRTACDVLDLGCGTGDLLPFFSGRNERYTGVDFSGEMIERARRIHAGLLDPERARFEQGDSEALPFDDGTFDLVTAVALIEYFADPNPTLDEIDRVLAPGGLALLTVPHRSCINFTVRGILAPLRRALFPLYVRLRNAPLHRMADVRHHHYDPEELDEMMAARSMDPLDARFTNFTFVVHPLDHVLEKTYMRLSEWADRGGRGERYRRFAANYIALYRKAS